MEKYVLELDNAAQTANIIICRIYSLCKFLIFMPTVHTQVIFNGPHDLFFFFFSLSKGAVHGPQQPHLVLQQKCRVHQDGPTPTCSQGCSQSSRAGAKLAKGELKKFFCNFGATPGQKKAAITFSIPRFQPRCRLLTASKLNNEENSTQAV